MWPSAGDMGPKWLESECPTGSRGHWSQAVTHSWPSPVCCESLGPKRASPVSRAERTEDKSGGRSGALRATDSSSTPASFLLGRGGDAEGAAAAVLTTRRVRGGGHAPWPVVGGRSSRTGGDSVSVHPHRGPDSPGSPLFLFFVFCFPLFSARGVGPRAYLLSLTLNPL